MAVFAAATSSWATINPALQMQLGNPSNATAVVASRPNYLIARDQFAMSYNDVTREPNWVAWDLTSVDVGGSGRAADFFQDTALPAGFYQVKTNDYSGSGYDRGHMCPSADRTITRADNDAVFVMSNMIPQSPDNNQGVWASFETECRTIASAGNEILIISGPSGFAGVTIASGVAVAGFTWKIAVVVPLGAGSALSRVTASTRVIAIKIPNIAGVRNNPWQQYVTSAAQIETDTGYTFFTALPASIAATLRVKIDAAAAPTGLPAITAQPVAQNVAVGSSATFTVAATSTADPSLTYQWYFGDLEIAGATAATLTVPNVQAANFGSYSVVITNSFGAVSSRSVALSLGAGAGSSADVAPVAYTGGTYTQNFDTLPTSGTFTFTTNGPYAFDATTIAPGVTALAGWSFTKYAGTGVIALFKPDNGGSNAGGVNAYGATGSTDRALGSVASGTAISRFGVSFVNTTGRTINQFSLSYTGEQWRHGGATTPNVLSFSYGVGATDLNSGVFTNVTALNFTAPIATTATAALDGNAAANRVFIPTATVTGLNWTPGQTLVLRWTDVDDAGSDDGLAIDDLILTTDVATSVTPVLLALPQPQVSSAGQNVTLSVTAAGAGPFSYQWRKDGVAIAGATNDTLQLTNLVGAQAGAYSVTVHNAAGNVTTRAANVTVLARSFAGNYFGQLGVGRLGAPGNFALNLRSDNTGTFLAENNGTVYISRNVSVDAAGKISFVAVATPATGPTTELAFVGTIAANGTLDVTAPGFTLITPKSANGPAASVAGFYAAYSAGSAEVPGQLLTIVGESGQTFALYQLSAGYEALSGTINAAGAGTIGTPPGPVLTVNVSSATNLLTAVLPVTPRVGLVYASRLDTALSGATERLANLSSRIRAGADDQVAIAGFVISGDDPKPVLIRAVGPALAQFGVSGVLAAPKLELYRNASVLASNSGWSTATNAAEIAAAAARAGAFAFAAGSLDSAIVTTLSPGAYTAVVSAGSGLTGVALIEIYDLTAAALGQKIGNLSTRAFAGTGSETLIAGMVVAGPSAVPRRLLVRATGPTLASFGVGGTLARPQLTLFTSTGAVLAQNSGWSTAANAADIAVGAAKVGAFPYANGSLDAAFIVNLAPGNYTAQVTGADGGTGVALVEVYELP